jgi:signal transduction histidine kinase
MIDLSVNAEQDSPKKPILGSALGLSGRIRQAEAATGGKPAISGRKRVEMQLAAEKRLLEMVASGHPLAEVLSALCRFVEMRCADCHCGVYLICGREPTLRKAASPSFPDGLNGPICDFPVRCEAAPCARAAHLKTQVIAEDLEWDPLWRASSFRPLALAHGIRSCWSTPIYSLTGRVLGTLAIFQPKPARPTSLQQDLIVRVTHIAGIAIERAQGEAALRRSEAFLAEAQRLTAAGSFSWRVSTDEITCSEQLHRIFEFDQGLPATLQDIPLLNEMIDRARAAAGDFEYEHRLVMPDGAVKHLHLVAHATREPDGELEYIGAVQDVTQRRSSEEALAKARSELAHVARIMSLGALTASIAHEVNQPLSGIVTNAGTCLRMLAADPPDLDGARETARRTLRDGNRASDVITRLRALFSKKPVTTEVVDLNEAAREVIALSLSDLQRRKIVLCTELAGDLPPVTGDRIQLQQVILNLLLNAADAMNGVEERPRQLSIKTEPDDGNRVRLCVRDAGIGLAPEALKIFEPFYTTKSEGMGIGLSVSRTIIESHHGRLWAAPNDGPGATFTFSIPCSRPHL